MRAGSERSTATALSFPSVTYAVSPAGETAIEFGESLRAASCFRSTRRLRRVAGSMLDTVALFEFATSSLVAAAPNAMPSGCLPTRISRTRSVSIGISLTMFARQSLA